MTSYQNLQSKIFNLKSHRSLLAISGEDARTFLQGLITNDINKLSPNNPVYALMLNPQGRFLYDFFIYEYNGKILLDCNALRLDEIKKKLSMYKLRSKVVIEDVSNELQVAAIIKDANIAVDSIFPDPRSPSLPLRAITTNGTDFTEGIIENYEYIRISVGIPSDQDMEYDKSFPLEYEMDKHNAIDYKKGCYVGQEVTARTHYRGTVRKKPYIVMAAENIDLAQYKDQEITCGTVKIGSMRSSAGNIGIALLRIEDLEKAKGDIEVAGIKLEVKPDQ